METTARVFRLSAALIRTLQRRLHQRARLQDAVAVNKAIGIELVRVDFVDVACVKSCRCCSMRLHNANTVTFGARPSTINAQRSVPEKKGGSRKTSSE